MKTVVAGTFEDEEAAQRAVQLALDHSFNRSEISVLVYEDGRLRDVPVVHRTGVARGAAIGAALGAVLGTVFVGPAALIGVGPLLLLLEGAAAGAAAGTLTGALGGIGFWEDVADLHAKDLERGAIWVGIEAETRADEAEATLREAGARDVARTRTA